MKKTKVLFITPSLCQGGLEHSLIMMLELLDKEQYDITLFLYDKDITLLPLVPSHVKVIIDKDKNHYYRRPKAILFNMLKRINKEKYSPKLRTFIREQRAKHPAVDIFDNEAFDVAVSNAIGICTEMLPYIQAKKRYVFFRSSVDLHHEMLEREFPKYDGIIAVSPGVQEMLRKAYPMIRDKVLLLQNYVDAESVLKKASADCTLDFAGDTGIVRICSCGRLSYEKGFDMAVETAAILVENKCNFKWYFVGDGPERQKIEALIKKYSLHDYVCITGFIDNPFPIMKSCDIYVQPSYEESYGRTIKEAIILGCPVVSTATVGGNTLIRDGENGILTTIDAKGLAEGILSVIFDEELRNKCSTAYSIEDNLEEKKIFKDKLERLLSLGEKRDE